MIANQGYAAYANNRIMTASPAELTLMLYDGAIKFCNIAVVAIEKQDVEKAHTYIMKTELIIEEFQASLNHKYPIAKEFDNVYTYLMERLREANLTKDSAILEEILTHLRTMRDAWKEVMRITQNGSKIQT
jgi:flagellar protein FliS